MDEVKYVSGETRIFAIVGHPIEQVRSPEMITAEMVRRGHRAILIPLDVLPEDFETVLASLMRIQNLDGLVFTIPFKQRACALASKLGAQAQTVGAINALARGRDDNWFGDIFDGLGCVEAFRRRGHSFKDQRVMLIGAGGAGRAIAAAVAHESPRALRIFDIDRERATGLAADVRENRRRDRSRLWRADRRGRRYSHKCFAGGDADRPANADRRRRDPVRGRSSSTPSSSRSRQSCSRSPNGAGAARSADAR